LNAHEKLFGKFEVDCIKIGDRVISRDHVMEVAQVIVIYGKRDGIDCPMPTCEPVVSPTAEWSHPAADTAKVSSPPRKVSKFDVGECVIPSEILPDDHSWLDARPLHGLQGNQFLKLQMPGIRMPNSSGPYDTSTSALRTDLWYSISKSDFGQMTKSGFTFMRLCLLAKNIKLDWASLRPLFVLLIL
jgi:hypothetical protein